MKIRWNEMTVSTKFMIIVRIVASIGVVLLIQSIQEWKQHRGIAVFGLCAALFIFGCAIVVWFVR